MNEKPNTWGGARKGAGRKPRCAYCENEAIWAMQFISSEMPSFSRLGSYYRGFKVVKVCDDCKEHLKK